MSQKVVRTRLHVCVVKAEPQPDLLLPSVLAGLRDRGESYSAPGQKSYCSYLISEFDFVASIGTVPQTSPCKYET